MAPNLVVERVRPGTLLDDPGLDCVPDAAVGRVAKEGDLNAEIRRLHSPDVDTFEHFRPPCDDDFALIIQVIVGPQGTIGEESFDVELITPKRLAARIRDGGPQCGRHLLIVNEYNYAQVDA